MFRSRSRDNHGLRFLELRAAFLVEIMHPFNPPVRSEFDARCHRAVPHLAAVFERIRNVRDQRARFGAYLAALNAEAAVDAMRAIAA